MNRCAFVYAAEAILVLSTASLAQTEPSANLLPVSVGGDQKIECIWIKPGRFLMGSPVSDPLGDPGERPQREVSIDRASILGGQP
jgi:hypothetical protein